MRPDLLSLYDQNVYRSADLVAKLRLDAEAAEGLYRLGLNDLVLLDVDIELCLECVAYVLGSDSAEELTGVAGLGLDDDLHAAELLCVLLSLRLFLGDLRGLGLFLELERVYVVSSRLGGELAREQVVSCVAVGDFFQLALLALTLDVFMKNNLHFLLSPFRQNNHLWRHIFCLPPL